MRRVLRRLSFFARARRAEAELAEELELHRSLKDREIEDRGLAPREAAQEARRALGNDLLARDRARDVWIWPWLQDAVRDLRLAGRLLARQRLFTLASAGALALGLGASTTGFSLLNAALIRGLPFEDPDRIVAVGTTDRASRTIAGPQGYRGLSYPEFVEWRDATRAFDGLAAYAEATMNIGDARLAPERLAGAYLSWNAFRLLGRRPVLGRDFSREDDAPGGPAVVILGHEVWITRYGGSPAVIGRTVRINGLPAAVIGVMPAGFRFPQDADAWQPLAQMPGVPRERDARRLSAFGKLAAGIPVQSAQEALNAVAARLAREYPDTNARIEARVMPYDDRYIAPEVKVLLLSVMGAVTFVLLIACANVAHLLLARSIARAREFALRGCLGASRWRLARQMLVESLALALAGGMLGFAVGVVALHAFSTVINDIEPPPYWIQFVIDRRVFGFAAAASLGTAVLFGLAPALRVAKLDVYGALKDGGRTAVGGRRSRLWAGSLVVVEIALTFVLLAGAGSMLRRFWSMQHVSNGIDTEQLITMRLDLPAVKYAAPERRVAVFDSIQQRLDGLGAIRAAAIADSVPLIGLDRRKLTIEGRSPSATAASALAVRIGTRYFETIGLPVIRGRAFVPADGAAGDQVAVVNERFADQYLTGGDPIGRRIRVGREDTPPDDSPWLTVVGVSATIPRGEDPPAIVYLSYRAAPDLSAVLLVRADPDRAATVALLRDEVRAIDPDLPLWRIRTVEEWLAFLRWPERVFGIMLSIFAGIGLLLSIVGVYGITAQAVGQRTQEIGVRVALGARPAQVHWLVLRSTLMQLGLGLLLALPGALVVERLPFMAAGGPVALIPVILLLAGAAVAATIVPVRRATRLDPVAALRVE